MEIVHLIVTFAPCVLVTPVWVKLADNYFTDIDTLTKKAICARPTFVTTLIYCLANCCLLESIRELSRSNGIGVVLIEANRNLITVDTVLESDC